MLRSLLDHLRGRTNLSDPKLTPPGWGTYALKPKTLNRQWRDGRWAYMGGLAELGRYSIIAGYVSHFHPGGSVLDAGCGEGLLAGRLGPAGYSRYLGLDISREAIDLATRHGFPDATFVQGDVRTYQPETRFDTVVLNEVLYYLTDPIGVLDRIGRFVTPGGHLVGSMVVNENTAANWKALEGHLTFLDETVTSNQAAGSSWACRVWQPNPKSPR